jgi:O-antigen ligase
MAIQAPICKLDRRECGFGDMTEARFINGIKAPASSVSRTVRSSIKSPTIDATTIVSLIIAVVMDGLIAYEVSIPLAAIIFGSGVMTLAWFRRDLAFILILGVSPFVWDIGVGNVKMSISDFSLALTAPVMAAIVLRKRMLASNPMFWPTMMYLAVCCCSMFVNKSVDASITAMIQMVLYLVLAVYAFATFINGPRQVMPALYALIIVDMMVGSVAVASRAEYVLGFHKNAMGAQMSYGLLIAIELWLARMSRGQSARFLMGAICLLGAALVFSLSRGAWLGTILGLFLLLVLRNKVRFAMQAAVVLLPLIAICWSTLPQESRDYATNVNSDSYSAKTRIASINLAMSYFQQSPLIGQGVGLRKTYDATNVVLSTLAETGILGFAAFVAMFIAFFLMVWQTQRVIDRQEPIFSLLSIGAALMIAKLAHGCVDHYWSRGALPVWAGAGMAVYAYDIARRKAAFQTSR